jgi:hypothetical protein
MISAGHDVLLKLQVAATPLLEPRPFLSKVKGTAFTD